VAQVAEHLDVTEEQVLEAIEAGSSYRTDTLDVRGPDDNRGHDVAVVDPSFDGVLDKERFRAVLPRLDSREQSILKGLYLDGRTQQDLAGDLGISQMQVSRLLARTLAKLRR
jgi:RNA polymerase sigma-B factor